MNLATTVYPPDTLPLDEWRDHIAQYRSELAFDNGHCDYCGDSDLPVEADDDKIICCYCQADREPSHEYDEIDFACDRYHRNKEEN